MKLDALVNAARDALQGEPLRAITYGAIAVVWLVTHAAFAAGVTHEPGPAFNAILAAVTAAIAMLNEAIRLYVSPAGDPEPVVPPASPTPDPTTPDPAAPADPVAAG